MYFLVKKMDNTKFMNDHLHFFSDRLKELLDINGHTVKLLSEGTGIACSVLYAYLNDKRVPFLENAVKISNFYLCSLDFLFGFREDCLDKKQITVSNICDRLKSAIDNSGKSRYKISIEVGIDQADIARWYHGQRTPSLISLVKLTPALGCSLDYLAGRN